MYRLRRSKTIHFPFVLIPQILFHETQNSSQKEHRRTKYFKKMSTSSTLPHLLFSSQSASATGRYLDYLFCWHGPKARGNISLCFGANKHGADDSFQTAKGWGKKVAESQMENVFQKKRVVKALQVKALKDWTHLYLYWRGVKPLSGKFLKVAFL